MAVLPVGAFDGSRLLKSASALLGVGVLPVFLVLMLVRLQVKIVIRKKKIPTEAGNL